MTARRRIGELVEVDGHAVHVRLDGPPHAPAVVLVHGFSGSMHWFDGMAADLATGHRVLRVDLLGHGCSGAAAALGAAAQARAVSGVLERSGIVDATAVGHSFGADVVLATARRTDRVARVAVLGQAPDYGCSRLPSIAFLPVLPALATLAHRLTSWVRPGSPRRMALDRAAMDPRMYRTVLADRRARLAAHPLDVQARELGLPVLAVLGGRDRLYPSTPTAARYRAAGARVVVIDGAGHSVNVERPAAVAELIRDFTAGAGPVTPARPAGAPPRRALRRPVG